MEADLAQAVPHRTNREYKSLFKPSNFDLVDYYRFKVNPILFITLFNFKILCF